MNEFEFILNVLVDGINQTIKIELIPSEDNLIMTLNDGKQIIFTKSTLKETIDISI